MTETSKELPTTLSYTDDDISQDVKRKQYAAGWYALLCTGNTPKISQAGGVMFVQQWSPLKDASDPESKARQHIRDYMTLPFANPAVEGHKAPNTLGLCHGRLLAVSFPGVLEYPRTVDGVLVFDGEEISKEDSEAARKKVAASTRDLLLEVYNDPSKFVGCVAFGEVAVDGDYNKIKRFRSSLPEDAELLSPEHWFDGGVKDGGE